MCLCHCVVHCRVVLGQSEASPVLHLMLGPCSSQEWLPGALLELARQHSQGLGYPMSTSLTGHSVCADPCVVAGCLSLVPSSGELLDVAAVLLKEISYQQSSAELTLFEE